MITPMHPYPTEPAPIPRCGLITSAFIVCALVIPLIYSAARAASLAFTHDECLSYFAMTSNHHWLITANNHFLNTILMWIFGHFFGWGELALRLPNVLAHFLFTLAFWQLLRRICPPVTVALGLVLLNANPLAMDFFSLARGYGLALAFQALSLCLLLDPSFRVRATRRYLAQIASGLAVLASFPLLNYHIAFTIATIAMMVPIDPSRSFRSRIADTFRGNWRFLVLNASFIIGVCGWLLFLQRRRELYYGGNTGFLTDTIGSLLSASFSGFYLEKVTLDGLKLAVLSSFLLMLLIEIRSVVMHRKITFALIALSLLALSIGFIFFQGTVLHSPWPLDRTVLYLVPLFTLCAILQLGAYENSRHRFVGSGLLSGIVVISLTNFAYGSSFGRTIIWNFDADTRTMIEDLRVTHDADPIPAKRVKLGCEWIHEPTANYYRQRWQIDWLAPITREGFERGDYDYLYLPEAVNLRFSPTTILVRLQGYSSKSVLMRVVASHNIHIRPSP